MANAVRALLLLVALAPRARAEDFFPLGPGFEWSYLAFEDQGSRGLGFSHKMVRKVLESRSASGGTFYWVRESEADPDVGPNAEARYATDLLKLPFKPPRIVADELYFKDADEAYLKLRVEPPFGSKDEFIKQCQLFEGDKEPYRLRKNPYMPIQPATGMSWEGAAGSKSKVSQRGPWTSEAMRKQWPDVVTVEDQSPGRTQKTIYADGYGPIAWYTTTPKAKSYFELAERKFGNEQAAAAATPEIAELRLRGVLGPDQDEARPEDLLLLKEMRLAEAEGGIEFMKEAMGSVRPYTVERKRPDRHLDILFNSRGFEAYRFQFSQAAIRKFEDLGIQPKYIFYLVDGGDHPLFDEEGLLTQQGEDVFYSMRRGDKAVWKLPGQDLPPLGPKEGADVPEALALLAKGYEEITPPEFRYLIKASKCTEAQLESQYTLKKVEDSRIKKARYFLHKDDSLMSYVGVYRSGDALKSRGGPGSLIGGSALCQ